MNREHGRPLVVVGAGGHAKVVLSTLQDMGYLVEAIFDDDPKKHGSKMLGIPVVGSLDQLKEHGPEQTSIIAVGDARARKDIAKRLHLTWKTVVHPHSYVHPSVQMGSGTVIFAGAVIQPDSIIGDHVIVNTGVTVDHDCRIGNYAHLAPGVHLAGDVEIEVGAFLGTGTVAIPGVKVGAWTSVGAGAAIVRDLPSGVVAMGVPAVPRSLD